MAPKSLSRRPSEEKAVNKEPAPSSSSEESEDEGSESAASSSSEEKDKNDFSGETGQDEDEDQKSPKSKIDSESANRVNESDSDSDLGTPSSYKLQPVSRVSKSSSKRTRDVDQSQSPVPSSKKPKPVGSSTPGGGCINRLWSDEDELTVLNGMIKFNNNTDTGAFYNFIKGKLQEKFSKDQLISKIKRMKSRFSIATKKSKNGEDPVFSKPHEVKAFELSKKIWGGFVEKKGKNGKKDEKKAKKEEKGELEDDKETGKSAKDNGNEEVGFVGSKYPFLTRSFESIMSTMPSLEMSKSGMCFAMKRLSSKKAEELNQKWKVLIKEEVELNHKKLTLMQEQMNMALDFVE